VVSRRLAQALTGAQMAATGNYEWIPERSNNVECETSIMSTFRKSFLYPLIQWHWWRVRAVSDGPPILGCWASPVDPSNARMKA
jgi:hypothetical protein